MSKWIKAFQIINYIHAQNPSIDFLKNYVDGELKVILRSIECFNEILKNYITYDTIIRLYNK